MIRSIDMEDALSRLIDRINQLEKRIKKIEETQNTQFQFTYAPNKPEGYSLSYNDGCDGCENWGVDS